VLKEPCPILGRAYLLKGVRMETIWNWLINKLNLILSAILSFLPDSPFENIVSPPQEVVHLIGYINYFLPISQIVGVLMVWISAVTVFYVYQLILRWAKAIE